MKLQEEGVQADLVQELAEEVSIFWAEISFVLVTYLPKWLFSQAQQLLRLVGREELPEGSGVPQLTVV